MKLKLRIEQKGGAGSGFHGHSGRPGKVGGSAPGTGGGTFSAQEAFGNVSHRSAAKLRNIISDFDSVIGNKASSTNVRYGNKSVTMSVKLNNGVSMHFRSGYRGLSGTMYPARLELNDTSGTIIKPAGSLSKVGIMEFDIDTGARRREAVNWVKENL